VRREPVQRAFVFSAHLEIVLDMMHYKKFPESELLN